MTWEEKEEATNQSYDPKRAAFYDVSKKYWVSNRELPPRVTAVMSIA